MTNTNPFTFALSYPGEKNKLKKWTKFSAHHIDISLPCCRCGYIGNENVSQHRHCPHFLMKKVISLVFVLLWYVFFIFITDFCVALRTASIKCAQSRALIRQIVFHLENHTFMLPHFIFFLPLPFDLIYSYTYRQPPQWSGVRWQSQFFCSRQRTLQRLVLDNLTKVLISSWEYHPILCLARLLCPGADSTVK